MYLYKKGKRVDFKPSYRAPRMSGVIRNSGQNLVWIKLEEAKGKKINKDQQVTLCVDKNHVIV